MTGLCRCGCGEMTALASSTCRRRNQIKGRPLAYVHGHNRRKSGVAHIEDANGCWVWQRTLSNGYGMQWDAEQRRVRGAHVLAWEKDNGPVPPDRQLDHVCRNRACVNPKHLEVVTRVENVRRGSAAKLTASAAEWIRELCGQGWVQADIARAFGVTPTTVMYVKQGKVWA